MTQNQWSNGQQGDGQWQQGSDGWDQGHGGDWQQQQAHHHYHQQQPPRQKRRFGTPRFQNPHAVANASEEERVHFIRRTYTTLMAAIFGCVAMMGLFMMSPAYEPVMTFMINSNWLIVLALFIGFSWMGDYMAHRVDSKGLQLVGLAVGVGAYAIILTLPVTIAVMTSGPDVLIQALVVTLLTFAALTAVVFKTGFDFSILRTGLVVASFLAIGSIVAGAIFGFTLGLGFAVIMVGLSSAMIIYQTSNIIHVYGPNQHVGAALGLFSSIGMLFWYILSIFMSFDG